MGRGEAATIASNLAAVSRAYRHLRWREEGSLPEAVAAAVHVSRHDAPAFYAALAAQIVEEVQGKMREGQTARLDVVADAVERELDANRVAERPLDADALINKVFVQLASADLLCV